MRCECISQVESIDARTRAGAALGHIAKLSVCGNLNLNLHRFFFFFFLLFSFSSRGFFSVVELCAAVGDVRSVARHHRDAIVDWAHADAERASSAVGGDFGDVRVGRERDGLVARVVARHVALTWGHQCLQTRR